MNYPHERIVFSEEETAKLAVDFAMDIICGDVIVLNGNLGSGKTFFIKKALDYFKIYNASSPTFALVNEYDGLLKVYHFDFYRINSERELFDIGFNDYLNNNDAVIFIEWGNLIPGVIPQKRYEIQIIVNDNLKREFKIEKYS